MNSSFQESRVGRGRGGNGKENPRRLYATTLRVGPAYVVRGSSRRINILRFQPANIRLINRRDIRLDCAPLGFPRAPDKNQTKIPADVDRSFHIRDVALPRLTFLAVMLSSRN